MGPFSFADTQVPEEMRGVRLNGFSRMLAVGFGCWSGGLLTGTYIDKEFFKVKAAKVFDDKRSGVVPIEENKENWTWSPDNQKQYRVSQVGIMSMNLFYIYSILAGWKLILIGYRMALFSFF